MERITRIQPARDGSFCREPDSAYFANGLTQLVCGQAWKLPNRQLPFPAFRVLITALARRGCRRQRHEQLNAIMTTTTTDDAVLQKTKELCQAIVDQPDFQALRRQVDAFMASEESKSQYQLLVEKGEMLQHKQQTGSPLSHDEIAAFEKQRELLMNNP